MVVSLEEVSILKQPMRKSHLSFHKWRKGGSVMKDNSDLFFYFHTCTCKFFFLIFLARFLWNLIISSFNLEVIAMHRYHVFY